jgi:Na+-transporting NADH:ubiquinone oxidoreductase subunit A
MQITEGLDIPIEGVPEQSISDCSDVSSVAVLGGDYVGLSPALQVRQGDRVKLGQPLFADRKHPSIIFASPGSGVVAEVNRGARRALLSVVVRLDGDDEENFLSWSREDLPGLRRDQVTATLLDSGLWTALRARPYGKVADPETTPRSIFVTAIDSNPLAARPEAVIGEKREAFGDGLTVLSHLTDGPVFLCKAPGADLPLGESGKTIASDFSGPHPSGLVGTHIHFLDPVGAKRIAWHLNYQDVMAIGKLFTTGRLWTGRVISLAGPVVRRPRLIRTRLGADLAVLTRDELKDVRHRVISGSVLSGREARKPGHYLGRYHNQVSVIADARPDSRDRWLGDRDVFSTYGLWAGGERSTRKYAFTTAMHGRPAAMAPFGGFEKVMPLDILPTQLLRALLVGDTDMAQALGCLELDEEDLALCGFVCPGKIDYGASLRDALQRIEKEG